MAKRKRPQFPVFEVGFEHPGQEALVGPIDEIASESGAIVGKITPAIVNEVSAIAKEATALRSRIATGIEVTTAPMIADAGAMVDRITTHVTGGVGSVVETAAGLGILPDAVKPAPPSKQPPVPLVPPTPPVVPIPPTGGVPTGPDIRPLDPAAPPIGPTGGLPTGPDIRPFDPVPPPTGPQLPPIAPLDPSLPPIPPINPVPPTGPIPSPPPTGPKSCPAGQCLTGVCDPTGICTQMCGPCPPGQEPPGQQPPGPAPPTCPPMDYCVWVDSTGCASYVRRKGQSPNATGDSIYVCDVTASAASDISAAYNRAAAKTEPCSTTPSEPTPPPTFVRQTCQPDFYCQVSTADFQGLTSASGVVSFSTAGDSFANRVASAVPGGSVILAPMLALFRAVGNTLGGAIDGIVKRLPASRCRNGTVKAETLAKRVVFGFIERWIGLDLTVESAPERYLGNLACPLLFPNLSQAIDCYLGDTVDGCVFQSWVEINGFCIEPIKRVVDAQRSKNTPAELVKLREMSVITPQQYSQGMRALGYLYSIQHDATWEASRARLDDGAIVALVRRGFLSEADGVKLLQWNGWREPAEIEALSEATRALFNTHDLVDLRRRGLITDQEFHSRLTWNGWTTPQDQRLVEQLGWKIPPYTDLVKMMVRDTQDDRVVTKFGLDSQFGDKFHGQLAAWAHAQGISDEVMQHIWRAHWTYPAPGQLFQMYHRLRGKDAGEPDAFGYDDMKQALIAQDIPPYWVDRFLAISYNPLRLVDVQRAYALKSIDREQMRAAYTDRGYSDANADILAKFTHDQLLDRLYRSPRLGKYATGEITEAQLREYLRRFPLDESEITGLVRSAVDRLQARTRMICSKNTRKQFMVGAMTGPEAQADLIDRGYDIQQASELIKQWQCESASRTKQAQASQLCEWLNRGLIQAPEMIGNLQNLGWSERDATNLVIVCLQKQGEKNARQAEAIAKREKAAVEKAKREADREKARLAKQAKDSARAANAAQAALAKRDAQIVRVATIYANQLGLDISDTFQQFQALRYALKAEFGLSPDQAVASVVLAVEKRDKSSDTPIEPQAREIAESYASA